MMRSLLARRLPVLGAFVGALALLSLLLGAADSLVIGIIVGLVYGVTAMGLVLIYKGSRVLNFAHGQMATLGAFAAWGLLTDPGALPGQYLMVGLPWLLAGLIGLGVGALSGTVVEATVIRRLQRAPRLILLVATLAAGQVINVVIFLIWLRDEAEGGGVRAFPSPFEVSWRVGDITILGAHVLAAVVVPAVGLGLAAFFRFTRFGIAIRATSDNADAARLLGVSARRVSLVTWGLGGGLAALAGILIAPIQGGLSVELLSIGLLVRALGAAILGGLTSLPGALVGGIAVGLTESLLERYSSTGGLVETAVFGFILLFLLLFSSGEDDESRISYAPPSAPVGPWIREHWSVGIPRFALGYWLLAGALAAPLLLSPSGNFTFALMVIYAMLGISLNLLMGIAGQVSLGHFAFLGVGAYLGAKLVTDGQLPYLWSAVLAGLVGGLLALLVGIPALRIRGLSLAIATLAFAVAAQSFLFPLDLFGARRGISFARPELWGVDLNAPSGREFSYVCLAALGLFIVVFRNLVSRRGGRALLAVRENERSAAVLGVPVRGYKLMGFTISGVLAAWAGVLYGMLNPPVQSAAFTPLKSLELVAMVIIGGLGSVGGAVLGAVYIIGIPRMFPGSDIAPLLATGFGLLLVLLVRPGGLWSLVTGVRDGFVWALTVEDRAFKGPLSHLVPSDVPTAGRIQSLFADDDSKTPAGDGTGAPNGDGARPDASRAPVGTGGRG